MFNQLFNELDYKIIGTSCKANIKSMLSNLKYNMKCGYDLRDNETYWIIYNDGSILNTNNIESYKEIKLHGIKNIIAFTEDIIADYTNEYETIYQ
jgi:hypothetical protein